MYFYIVYFYNYMWKVQNNPWKLPSMFDIPLMWDIWPGVDQYLIS